MVRATSPNLQQVATYVRNQPEHHRQRTFEEEFLALLKKHGIEANPAQVFAEGAALRAQSPFSPAFPALTRWAHTNVALTGSFKACVDAAGLGRFIHHTITKWCMLFP
jgi:hypothetical protein